jgi:hypothetical protein
MNPEDTSDPTLPENYDCISVASDGRACKLTFGHDGRHKLLLDNYGEEWKYEYGLATDTIDMLGGKAYERILDLEPADIGMLIAFCEGLKSCKESEQRINRRG